MLTRQQLPDASQAIFNFLAGSAEPRGLVAITASTGLSYSTASIHSRLLVYHGLAQRVNTGRGLTFCIAPVAASELGDIASTEAGR